MSEDNEFNPVFLYGDSISSQIQIELSKKKYCDFNWVIIDGSMPIDEIRTLSGQNEFIPSKRIFLIKDLPNSKSFREFVLDLVESKIPLIKYIVWDSDDAIKLDPKNGTPNKTWGDFIGAFRKIKGATVINNGGEFKDNVGNDCLSFIKNEFAKRKRKIDDNSAKIFSEIVGSKRGFIVSEVKKLCLIAPATITDEFLVENCFPSSNDAILYKLNNAMDSFVFTPCIMTLNSLVNHGINGNVLAEIIVKKARWQLAAASYWKMGENWNHISKLIVNMGKYPSSIWHDHLMDLSNKKKISESLKEIESRIEYITMVAGVPPSTILNKSKAFRAEVIPMEFMAQMMLDGMYKRLIMPNLNAHNEIAIKTALESRCLNAYLKSVDGLKEIRYGNSADQLLQDMIKVVTMPLVIKESE
jgi:hypothetical protein